MPLLQKRFPFCFQASGAKDLSTRENGRFIRYGVEGDSTIKEVFIVLMDECSEHYPIPW
jgi:hypothetical protein